MPTYNSATRWKHRMSFRHTPLGARRKNMRICFTPEICLGTRPRPLEIRLFIPVSTRWLSSRPLDLYPNVNLELCYDLERTFEINIGHICATNRHGYKIVNIRSGADDVFIDCEANFLGFKRRTLIRFTA